jgi:hypothetical protein
VDATPIRASEIDEGADPGAGALDVTIASVETDRHLDAIHADPIQRCSQMWLRLDRDIGHQGDGFTNVFHGGLPIAMGLSLPDIFRNHVQALNVRSSHGVFSISM